jgi:hypothetical protein
VWQSIEHYLGSLFYFVVVDLLEETKFILRWVESSPFWLSVSLCWSSSLLEGEINCSRADFFVKDRVYLTQGRFLLLFGRIPN